MPRPRTTPLTAMKASLESAKTRVAELEAEVKKAQADVTQFERCVKILEDQQPVPTIIPPSATTTAAKAGK